MAVRRNPELVQVLLEAGAPVDMRDTLGRTALMTPMGGYNDAGYLALINAGADVNLQDQDGFTALMYAIADRRVGVVKSLLNVKNLNIDIQNNKRETALILARKTSR